MSNNYDFLFKFIIIGDSTNAFDDLDVGKSCLLLRFTEGRYKAEHEPTLGVEFGSKNIKVGQQTIKVQIWDTAGQESFKSITRSYYKGYYRPIYVNNALLCLRSIAALIVYDISKRDSFDNIVKWLHEVKSHSHEKVEIVLIGNKCDLADKREVSYQQGEKFAKKNNFEFFETSAMKGDKVQDVFRMLAARIVKKIQNHDINPESESSYGFRRGKKSSSPKKDSTIYIKKSAPVPTPNQGESCSC